MEENHTHTRTHMGIHIIWHYISMMLKLLFTKCVMVKCTLYASIDRLFGGCFLVAFFLPLQFIVASEANDEWCTQTQVCYQSSIRYICVSWSKKLTCVCNERHVAMYNVCSLARKYTRTHWNRLPELSNIKLHTVNGSIRWIADLGA